MARQAQPLAPTFPLPVRESSPLPFGEPSAVTDDHGQGLSFAHLGTDAAHALADQVIEALRTLGPDASVTTVRMHIAGVLCPAMEALADRVRRETIGDHAERVAMGELRALVRDWRDKTERRIAIAVGSDEQDDEQDEGTDEL